VDTRGEIDYLSTCASDATYATVVLRLRGTLDMAYEIYARKTKRMGSPMVTFSTLGRISLNKAGTARFEKEVVEFVILMWDPSAHKVGIRPISKKDPRGYRVSYGKKGNGAGFSAKTFLDYIEYDYGESRSFQTEWNDQENMFEFEIPVEHLKDSRQRKLIAVDARAQRNG